MAAKAPKGFVLTKHAAYKVNAKGFRAEPGDDLISDGALIVAHFDDAHPFVAEGDGYSPNVELRPIKDGIQPAVYTLHTEKEAPR